MSTEVYTAPRAEHWPVDATEYHGDSECVSHSKLDVFIEDPALFEGRFVTGEFPEERKSCHDFGTMVHDVVLQGGTQCVIVEIPREVLSSNGSKAGAAWKQFEAEHSAPGKYLLKSHEIPPIRRCFDSVKEHPKARAILDYEGDTEYPIRWTDPETGLRLRSMLDKLTPHFICDLKTTRSTNKRTFENDCYTHGYHRQAAMYQDAVEQLTGDLRAFVFIAVKNDAPFSVETYVPTEDFIELGRQENRDALRDLAECKATGIWKRKGWGTLVPISGPQWAFNRKRETQ